MIGAVLLFACAIVGFFVVCGALGVGIALLIMRYENRRDG